MEAKKTEWELDKLFGYKDGFFEENEKEVKEACERFVKKWKSRNDYMESADSLKEALDDYENWARYFGNAGKAGMYSWLLKSKKQDDSKVIASYNKTEELGTKISNDMQFFTLNLSKVHEDNQKKFLSDARLSNYKHFLKLIFLKGKHVLSEESEKVINTLGSNAYDKWSDMTSLFLSKSEEETLVESGKMEKKTFSELMKLIDDKDKKIRDNAAEKINKILSELSQIAEIEINAILSFRKSIDELRGFDRPDRERHMDEDIETEVVDSLIDATTKRFDISHRFYQLKSKLMGVEKIKYHERNVHFGDINDNYDFEKSLDIVNKVFLRLDKKFSEILNDFIENGKIDVYPAKGKMDGAFCSDGLLSNPVFVLLNHVGTIRDVTTLAHEMGHAINNELSKAKQNSINFQASLSTAEVASTFMEDFVYDEILSESDDEQKLSILIKKLSDDISTIIRQVACYNFESELHKEFREKGYLSKEEIGKIFQKNMGSYMGPYVEQSAGSENWWIYWSHIRTYFYVYSYASGLLISKALQNEVRKDASFVEKVKEFLSAGSVKSPKEIFLDLGIDITRKEFWDEGLDRIENLLDEAENLAKKLGKL